MQHGATPPSHPDIFACPHCQQYVRLQDAAYYCTGCNKRFPIRFGVPSFAARGDHHFEEVPQQWMEQFVALARDRGWSAAFEQLRGQLKPDYAEHLVRNSTDVRRAAWKFVTAMPADGIALDLGCGWGALSIGLANNLASVVAMDLDPNRAEAALLQARQLGVANLLAVHGGDTRRLPFRDSTFDLVVLNGVFEYAATLQPGNPRRVQQEFLREIQRVLKPSGEIYIGIENRFHYRHFLGWPDPHTKLRFGTLWPRPLAHAHSWLAYRHGYRHYTYGRSGYLKLLQRAGFAAARIYCPYPQYYNFQILVDPCDTHAVRRAFMPRTAKGQMMLRLATTGRFLKHFAPGFAIVGSKSDVASSFCERLARELSKTLGETLGFSHLRVANSNKALAYFRRKTGETAFIAILPLNVFEERRTENSLLRLCELKADTRAKTLSSFLPSTATLGILDGQKYIVQSFIDGVPAHELVSDRPLFERVADESMQILANLHQATAMPIRCDQTVLRELFLACANRVHQFAPKSFSTEMLEKLSQQTRTMLSDKSVPLVWGHRDFVPQHVFVNGASGAIAGIIDWEFSQEGELPLIDAINFQVHAIHECQGITTSAAYLQFLRSNTRSLDRYTDRMGLDEPTVKALLLLYWPWLVDMHITGMFRDRVEKSVARYLSDFESTIETALKILFETRGHMNDFSVPSPRLHELAGELGAYSGAPLDQVRARLEKELRRLGDRMAEQWREQRPVTSRQIERFYRETDGYLYELLIDGENPFRAATRDAITQALREVNAQRVFEFGGGIGTDAMWFARAGFQWTYYDLPGGQTFRFAAWRFAKNKLPVTVVAHPSQSAGNDAVISIEVFEHLTNLFAALRTINRTLRPGGLLIFTESFGKTERHPLHLARVALQGRFLTELLRATGFKSLSRFGPEDYLYRAVKCREAAWHDCPRAVALICGRVIRKAPVKLWRALFGPRLATGHSQS